MYNSLSYPFPQVVHAFSLIILVNLFAHYSGKLAQTAIMGTANHPPMLYQVTHVIIATS